jgi:hypothetical protein
VRPIETISGVEVRGDNGKKWRNEFNNDIL